MYLKFLVLFLLLTLQSPCFAIRSHLHQSAAYRKHAKDAILRARKADVYKYQKQEDDQLWINRFKSNFLRNLKMAKPPKPLNVTRSEVLKDLPDIVVKDLLMRYEHMALFSILDYSVYVKGEGFNANFGSVPIQTFFFKPHRYISDELIDTTYITFNSENPDCHGSKILLYEIVTEDGNARDLRDETSLLNHYHMKMNFENDKLKLISEYTLGDPMLLFLNLTTNWLEWSDQYRKAKFEGDNFYKGFVLKCEDCKCENPIDTEKASLAIKYHDGYYRKFIRKHKNRRDDDFFERETYLEKFAAKIKNDCRKVGVNLCCTKKLIIDVKEIGWDDWILFPPAFTPNVCYGKCKDVPGPWNFGISNYNVVGINKILTNAVRNQYPGEDMQSCCAPKEHAPQIVVFIDEKGQYNTVEYPNFSVVDCGCS